MDFLKYRKIILATIFALFVILNCLFVSGATNETDSFDVETSLKLNNEYSNLKSTSGINALLITKQINPQIKTSSFISLKVNKDYTDYIQDRTFPVSRGNSSDPLSSFIKSTGNSHIFIPLANGEYYIVAYMGDRIYQNAKEIYIYIEDSYLYSETQTTVNEFIVAYKKIVVNDNKLDIYIGNSEKRFHGILNYLEIKNVNGSSFYGINFGPEEDYDNSDINALKNGLIGTVALNANKVECFSDEHCPKTKSLNTTYCLSNNVIVTQTNKKYSCDLIKNLCIETVNEQNKTLKQCGVENKTCKAGMCTSIQAKDSTVKSDSSSPLFGLFYVVIIAILINYFVQKDVGKKNKKQNNKTLRKKLDETHFDSSMKSRFSYLIQKFRNNDDNIKHPEDSEGYTGDNCWVCFENNARWYKGFRRLCSDCVGVLEGNNDLNKSISDISKIKKEKREFLIKEEERLKEETKERERAGKERIKIQEKTDKKRVRQLELERIENIEKENQKVYERFVSQFDAHAKQCKSWADYVDIYVHIFKKDAQYLEQLARYIQEKENSTNFEAILDTVASLYRPKIENIGFSLISDLSEIDDMSGNEFEDYIQNMFAKLGYDVTKTKMSRDGGIDLILKKDNQVTLVQAKRYQITSSVGVEAVRAVYSKQKLYKADRLVVLTTAMKFSTDARKESNELGVELWNRDKFKDLLRKSKLIKNG